MRPPEWNSRGYVPHFDPPGAVQLVTFRTRDSLPAHVTGSMVAELRFVPSDLRDEAQERRVESYLASGHGECLLRRPDVAPIIARTLTHYHDRRYRLVAWCLMPNHVHVVVTCIEGYSLRAIVHGWKSFSANEVNRHLGRQGALWMPDYFDRVIRDDAHLGQAITYVHANPVRAGLCARDVDWPWSSAREWLSRLSDVSP